MYSFVPSSEARTIHRGDLPEDHLKRAIKKEMRKAGRDEYKATLESEVHGLHTVYKPHGPSTPRVHFLFPAETVRVRPEYTVGYPGVSVSMELGLGLGSGPVSTPSYVPADLAARGIRAVEEKPRTTSVGSSAGTSVGISRCFASGCFVNHAPSEHYCNVCRKFGATHIDANCPLHTTRRFY
jgi:hypothetical protein